MRGLFEKWNIGGQSSSVLTQNKQRLIACQSIKTPCKGAVAGLLVPAAAETVKSSHLINHFLGMLATPAVAVK